ncbi:MAG: EpsG family protein [Lachnospiraceae bacterium]|nr:EpsG family protein [Lachnospiraceae bacterium]
MAMYILLTAVCVTMAFFVNGSYRRQLNIVGKSGEAFDVGGRAYRTAMSSRQEIINRCMLVGIFLVLFALSALRVGIGNDYWTYRTEFVNIHRADTDTSFEIGFQTLVRFIQLLVGADKYVPIFAVVAFFTCLFFIKGIYDTSDWFVMSFFLFMANGFYFMSFSNIRYYLVLALVVYSMKFLFSRRFIPFCLIIVFAAFFHMTVLIVIPAYFIAYFLKWNKKTYWMIPVASAILFFARIPIRRLIFVFYPFYEGDAILDVANVSYVNIAKCAAVLVFSLIYYKKAIKGNAKAETFFNMNLFALLLYSFATYIPELSRICYYLIIGQIFLLPTIIQSIEKKSWKIFWTVSITIAYFMYFIMFLIEGYNPVIQILPYFSWYFS